MFYLVAPQPPATLPWFSSPLTANLCLSQRRTLLSRHHALRAAGSSGKTANGACAHSTQPPGLVSPWFPGRTARVTQALITCHNRTVALQVLCGEAPRRGACARGGKSAARSNQKGDGRGGEASERRAGCRCPKTAATSLAGSASAKPPGGRPAGQEAKEGELAALLYRASQSV